MNRIRSVVRVIALVLLATAIAWALWHRADFNPAALQAWLQGCGIWAPLIFVAVYALATVLFVPGSILSLAGGALFGPVWGTLDNLAGATMGATLSFLLARFLLADGFTGRTRGRLQQLAASVEAEGWRFAAFVRLVPLFPFNLLNYALGLTRIGLGAYVLTTLLCMIPGAVAYTYLGYAGREALAGGEGLVQKGLLGLGLLAGVLFLPRFVRRLRQRVPGQTGPEKGQDPLLDGGSGEPKESRPSYSHSSGQSHRWRR
jgi:uncharacterized membrane protein YdjX (TVP38/TMEM64 family)